MKTVGKTGARALLRVVGVAGFLVAMSPVLHAQNAAPSLPGGASALSETHGDWTVNCRIANDAKACAFSHQQFDKASNQRLLAIELTTRDAATATGTLALPFGLALQSGVTLQIDDTKLEGAKPFSTCLAAGCLVPVTFDAKLVGQLKAGGVLKVNATTIDTGQPVVFSISLTGFASAIARTAELLKG